MMIFMPKKMTHKEYAQLLIDRYGEKAELVCEEVLSNFALENWTTSYYRAVMLEIAKLS